MGWLGFGRRAPSEDEFSNDDAAQLMRMGYKQELTRHLSTFRNFCVCISFLSPITGLTGTFGYTWTYGGPVAVIWGWCLVVVFNLCIGLALAESASAFPTTGGVFYWAGRMGGRRWGPLASWLVGFYCVLGEIACTAGVAYTTATLVSQFILLGTGGNGNGGYVVTQPMMLGIYSGVLVLLGMINTFSVSLLDMINEVSVWWHVVFCTLFVIALPVVAPTHQSAAWVFGSFTPDFAYSGVDSAGFMFLLALLGSQWAMVGYDAAAHMSEETHDAAMAGPVSLISTILAGFVVGVTYLLALLFSVQDPANVTSYDAETAGGSAAFQIVWDVFEARYGSGTGALGLMTVPLVCSVFCGNACLIACSRVMWAFSRDGDLAVSRFLHTVHPTLKAPINAVWASVLCQFILGLPLLYSYTAFAAITSIGVVGLYISYLVPLVLRVTAVRTTFQPGPFHLGGLSFPIHMVAISWACLAICLFIIPQVYPVTVNNLNYAPVAVGAVLILSLGWWVLNARTWFHGPRVFDSDSESDDDSGEAPKRRPTASRAAAAAAAADRAGGASRADAAAASKDVAAGRV